MIFGKAYNGQLSLPSYCNEGIIIFPLFLAQYRRSRIALTSLSSSVTMIICRDAYNPLGLVQHNHLLLAPLENRDQDGGIELGLNGVNKVEITDVAKPSAVLMFTALSSTAMYPGILSSSLSRSVT